MDHLSRRRLLTGAMAVAAATAAGGPAAATPQTPQAPRAPRVRTREPAKLWREFARTPYTHPQIPYVGRAGHKGGADFPRLPVVANVLDHGAKPDGSADAAPAINRAIAAAARAGGGTVHIPAETKGRPAGPRLRVVVGDGWAYRIDGLIHLAYDHVVLRGDGSERTKLLATKHLTELIGPYGSRYGGDKSSWSWAGDLIWLSPKGRWDSLTEAIKAADWPFEGWTGNKRDAWDTLTAVEPAERGAWSVTVADASRLTTGALVLLCLADDAEHTLLEHMAGEGPGPEAYTWDDKTKLTSYVPYEWPVRVIAVDGRDVALERPLPLDIRPQWDPRFTTHVPALTGSGVEGLTLEAVETPQSLHLLDKGFNGVTFQCAYDCWADDVVVRHVDNGSGLVAASACTLRHTRVEGRGSHHPYFCREGSHDNLIEDFTIAQRTVPAPEGTQLHGINVEGLSSHNVWSRGEMEMGTFDTHRGMPFANVRTDITVNNNGRHGGDASAGPLYGARFAHWNVTVTNGRAGLVKIDEIAPYSATVAISEVREFDQIDTPDFTGELHARVEAYGSPGGVEPRNLYEAQRALKPPR